VSRRRRSNRRVAGCSQLAKEDSGSGGQVYAEGLQRERTEARQLNKKRGQRERKKEQQASGGLLTKAVVAAAKVVLRASRGRSEAR
jgi:hypothetical protein